MPTLTLRKAPTYTLTLQLYVRDTNTVSGSVLTLVEGAAGVYTCTVPTGDFDGQLIGFTDPVGPRFPIRNGIGYEWVPWSIIDATITVPPTIAAPVDDSVCRVYLRARRGASAIQSRVKILCGSTGRLADSAFASVAFNGETNGSGVLEVDLPWSSLSGVGKYRFLLMDYETGDVFHDRSVTVPDEETALYEDLT